ncbi:sulfurtransferase [Agromyces badenianii]|uniref:Sulfurtransferase n=1 Tax=Agromyces badenianii TaxID=2080742 RepID=A0A2S0WU69_9MICO|nr:rhodanese-like domain-containing protein [Agromyces badenianii]AWB94838.1 sulfurtransferase [Agromyces badenianii]
MTAPALQLPGPLVTAAWLAEHLGDERLVVVDASVLGVETPAGFSWLSGLDDYLIDGHVPGAVFAELLEEFSDTAGRFTFTRPDLERLEQAARAVGIDDAATVVVYDTAIGHWAARLWWLLSSAGFARVAVLDGGLTAWRAAGGALETGFQEPRAAGVNTLAPIEGYWADIDEVRRIVEGESEAALVCALPPSDFSGETGRRARRGHIPRSVNVPVGSVVDRDSRTQLHGPALTERLAPATASGAARVVVYCGAGIAAAGTGFALRRAGHTDVAVYDGSLEEWTADPEAPLVTLES